ncbi:MAG: hypothetical protein IJ223_04340 [Clostridia bacterium]|nr:hypothetical protein [Clostridia bacterium]
MKREKKLRLNLILQKVLGIAIIINLLMPNFMPLISIAIDDEEKSEEIIVDTRISKHIPYEYGDEKGVVLQQQVNSKREKSEENEEVIVRGIRTEVDVIEYDGIEPEKIEVTSINSVDYEWDKQNKKVIVNSAENFYVTYYYGENAYEAHASKLTAEEEISIEMGVSSTYTVVKDNQEKTVQGEAENTITVIGPLNYLVSASEEFLGESISKGKLYANQINQEGIYSININTKTEINIAKLDSIGRIEIYDNEIYYSGGNALDFEGAQINQMHVNTNDKTIKTVFSKDNLNRLFGDSYTIMINDGERNLSSDYYTILETITESTPADNDGNIVIQYANPVSDWWIAIPTPVKSGILYMENQKEIVCDNELTRDQIEEFDSINSNRQIKLLMADNSDNDIFAQTSEELEESRTQVSGTISERMLNAILDNEGVEIRLDLNNSKEQSDLWKNGMILIEMPEEIENVEITNLQLLYQDTISEVGANLIEYNNHKAILINLVGEQKHFISETIENGTAIIITCNLKIRDLTPSKENNEIKIYYYNENAKSYETEAEEPITIEEQEYDCGYTNIKVNYVANEIVYNVQKIHGYDNDKVLTSSTEEIKTDKIGISEEHKEIMLQNIVLNNTKNTITDVKILGKIAFKGNKDLENNEELGSNIDTKLKELIPISDKILHIYYSSNPTPSLDLANWTETPENLEDIKAYLIVLDKLEFMEKFEFTYRVLLPEKLEHCEYMYFTNGVYYSDTEAANKKAIPSKIGLTTGEGAILEVTQNVSIGDGTAVSENQLLRYEVFINNIGEIDAKNVIATSEIPNWSSYVEEKVVQAATSTHTQYNYYSSNNSMQWSIGDLKVGESLKLEFYLEANKIPTILEYYSGNPNFTKEEDKYYLIEDEQKTEITEIPPIVIESKTIITCENIAKDVVSNTTKNPLIRAYFIINEESSVDKNTYINEGKLIKYNITIANNTDLPINNVKISKKLPEGVTFINAKLLDRDEKVEYNVETRELSTILSSLDAGDITALQVEVKANKLEENEFKKEIRTNTKVTAEEKEATSSEVVNYIIKPKVITKVSYDVEQRNIYEEDYINIVITVKNEEEQAIGNLKISQVINDNFKFVNGTMEIGNLKTNITYDGQGAIYATTNLKKDETVKVSLKIKAANLKIGIDEKEAETVTLIEAENLNKEEISKKIYRVEKLAEHKLEELKNNDEIDYVDESGNILYKIQGQVWLDEDRNDERTFSDKAIANIQVYLLKDGDIVDKTITDEKGLYEFRKLSKGKYLVVFDYDTENLELTTYQKEGVATDNNSDVISSIVNIDGTKAERAITNEINVENRNIYNIDMGLVRKPEFDLNISTGISKIVLTTKAGIKTYEYDNAKLAKLEIKAKELNGAIALIEYSIKIKNVGDISGTASQIISYKNEMLTFNSETNPNWYIASDGNYYTNELENTVINPGEEKEIKLILVKNINENKIGTIENEIAISKIYNSKGLEEKDKNNNNSKAECLILVATGFDNVYTKIMIIAVLMVLNITGVIILKKTRGKEVKKIYK